MTYTTARPGYAEIWRLFLDYIVTFLNDIHNIAATIKSCAFLVFGLYCYFFEWHTQPGDQPGHTTQPCFWTILLLFWMTYTTKFLLLPLSFFLFLDYIVTFLNDIHNPLIFASLTLNLVFGLYCYFFEWHTQPSEAAPLPTCLVFGLYCYFFEWHTQLSRMSAVQHSHCLWTMFYFFWMTYTTHTCTR